MLTVETLIKKLNKFNPDGSFTLCFLDGVNQDNIKDFGAGEYATNFTYNAISIKRLDGQLRLTLEFTDEDEDTPCNTVNDFIEELNAFSPDGKLVVYYQWTCSYTRCYTHYLGGEVIIREGADGNGMLFLNLDN
jgi:hypothetical protein